MSRALDVLLDLIFPPRCVFCQTLMEDGEGPVCGHCIRALPYTYGSGAEQTCPEISLAVSPLRYEGEVRESIRRYKFHGRKWYASAYGPLVAQCVEEHLSGRFDLISWVPLSEKRRRERGYDQAFLLARAVGHELGMDPVSTLRKARNNPAQSGLTGAEDRRANVQGVYECAHPEAVAGQRVLLLDDVLTTGSTLSECARILRGAGAADVVCATLARAH